MNRSTPAMFLILLAGILAACGILQPSPSTPPAIEAAPQYSGAAPTASTSQPVLPATPPPQVSQTAPLTDTLTGTVSPNLSPALQPAGAPSQVVSGVSQAFLSSQAQLAYIQDGVLLVEVPAASGNFIEISRYVSYARWSPDGSMLLFDTSPAPLNDPGQSDTQLAAYEIWFAQSGQSPAVLSRALTELIPDFPTPPYPAASWIPQPQAIPAAFQNIWVPGLTPVGQSVWSSDSARIFFLNLVESEKLPVSFPGANTVVVADLTDARFWLAAEAVLISRIIPAGSAVHSVAGFVIQDHCGALCEWLTGYDLQGQELWRLPWVSDGAFATASDGAFLVNAGRISYTEPTDTSTVDIIDTATGEFQPIWKLAADENFVPSELYRVMLSPDGQYVSFNLYKGDQFLLQVIDLNGNSRGQVTDAINLAWQPGNGLIYLQPVIDNPGNVQIYYWNPVTAMTLPVMPATPATPLDGNWSPDGAVYAFCTFNPALGEQALYHWKAADQTLLEVQRSASAAATLCNITWLPDSSAHFFNLTTGSEPGLVQSLWKYSQVTASTSLVSPAGITP